MNNLIRTTITIPEDLYEQLRAASFYQKKSISALIREGVIKVIAYKKIPAGSGIRKLKGKYAIGGKKSEFNRKEFYEEIIKQKMST